MDNTTIITLFIRARDTEGRVLQGHEWKGGGGESWWLAAANQNTAHVEEVPRKGDVGQRVVGDEEMVVMENGGDENVWSGVHK